MPTVSRNSSQTRNKLRAPASRQRNAAEAMLRPRALTKAGFMYTIVAASQKGGSGKTTLSGHLAVEAARAGAGEIALIDTDPQGSLAAWWNARTAPNPHFVKAGLPDLERALAELHQAGIKI